MKILVVGSGGREHALAWKLVQSPHTKKLFCAPGNPGTMDVAENIPIKDSDIIGLADFAESERMDLTVVGPELPLTLGIVDEFERRGLRIFGPDQKTAELEGSKVFAKQFLERHSIPTALAEVADSAEKAKDLLNSDQFSFPLVIKADGLAAGKGAIVCKTREAAEEAVRAIMVDKIFGDSGNRILVEEFLRGKEASFIVLSDGENVVPLVTTMDHKPVYDGDKGPNTGGMGAISPSPFVKSDLFLKIMESIVFPTVDYLREEERKYKGVLYVGLMLTEEGPKVLEYNCRFGDPETQPQMVRMESDLVDILLSVIEGNASMTQIKWSPNPSACVVLASGGYPLAYEKGKKIEGLKEAREIPGITIFHAGTKYEGGEYYTNGGRVMGICASEETLAKSLEKTYEAIARISFEGMHFRKDIGTAKEGAK
jgi:phosphoribosylamine--glycine ligase